MMPPNLDFSRILEMPFRIQIIAEFISYIFVFQEKKNEKS